MPIDVKHPDVFANRHIGPDSNDVKQMLSAMGASSLAELIDSTVPKQIRLKTPLRLGGGETEFELLEKLSAIAKKNRVFQSLIGQGYSDCITPPVILRNVIENPGWYTQYTPYQAEIAQGRLEALLNFQTLVSDLSGLPIANASLLDEATAAAEAMNMFYALRKNESANIFFVDDGCFPQTLAVLKTRAEPLGIELCTGLALDFEWNEKVFGGLVQYPACNGEVDDYRAFCERAHQVKAHVVFAADILSLTLLKPPGEFGADVAVGSTQRLGVPMGFGGPHAAYFATRNDFVRQMPGRLIGVSQDSNGKPALRMALQTREQHIRREKATSNICTAQVLLAVVASMYAVYHGPQGLTAIARRIHTLTRLLGRGLQKLGFKISNQRFFDTLQVEASAPQIASLLICAAARQINFRKVSETSIGISLDETTSASDLKALWDIFAGDAAHGLTPDNLATESVDDSFGSLSRQTPFLNHPVFNQHHSETEMLRYIKMLESKDLSLTHSMIPLGSCTMKLNATTEMIPVTWPSFARLHPFAPPEQTEGYQLIFDQLKSMLCEITGFAAISLEPNAGSQGEYTGLLVIRKYHQSRGQSHRNVCLIPSSAHGTNPASATMAGYRVVVVRCDDAGNVDLADLTSKAEQHRQDLAALMVTYPSTYGVFEERIREICSIVHQSGGQVYMDGANMNAQVGLCRPGDIGADVCHLNLHKTFCIPHGGGGPGMGPIGVGPHLVKFLPGGMEGIGAVSAAPYGSASILLIPWAYISMMGGQGLTRATEIAILNANYIVHRLSNHYPILFLGRHGRVAHECVVDLRPLKRVAGIEVEDVAKRLIDYGFHAPTVSFPVSGTVMIEPTESESKAELDRFCDAMISIRGEIRDIEEGRMPRENNLLKNSPHTAESLLQEDWSRPYSRAQAAYPNAASKKNKFWPSVGRLNNVLGDRNLVCSCPPVEDYV